MKKIISYFAILFIGIFTCSGQCPIQESTSVPAFHFSGFSLEEVRGTLVKQVHNNEVIDSFFVRTDGVYDNWLKLSYGASFTARHRIKVKDTYLFFIPGYPTYTLSNMKIIPQQVMPTATLCNVHQYDLNGITYNNCCPEFMKPGTEEIIQRKIDSIKSMKRE